MNIFSRTLLACVYLSSSIFLTNCEANPLVTSQSNSSPDFVNKWLEDNNCLPPCWNDIKPNETSLDEALLVLNSVSEINYVEVVTSTNDLFPSNVVFDTVNKFDGEPGQIGGTLSYNAQDKIIKTIHYYPGDSLSFEQIIEVLGEPTHIFSEVSSIDNDTYSYWMQLFYMENGIRLDWAGKIDKQSEYMIMPDETLNFHIMFFDPNSSIDINNMINNGEIYDWPGFATFEVDCTGRICHLSPILN